MQVSRLALIQSGYTVRSPLPPDELGVLVAQVRDLPFDREVEGRGLQRYRVDGSIERYLIRSGDVVFRSRGERTTALALGAAFGEPAVALLPLIILRPDPERVLPEYLAWAINQPRSQQQLDEAAQGASLRMVPRVALESLDIAVPPLNIQAKVIAMQALIEREDMLARELAMLRSELLVQMLGNAVERLSITNPFELALEPCQS